MKKFKHNFNSGLRLSDIVAKTIYRPVMSYVYFKDGFAYVSDSYCIIKAKLTEISSLTGEEISNLDNKLLHGKHFKELLSYDIISIAPDCITATRLNIKGSVRFELLQNGGEFTYPNAESVIKEMKERDSESGVLRFTPNILSRFTSALTAAMGTHSCDLYFKQRGGCVVSIKEYETMGVIMTQMVRD